MTGWSQAASEEETDVCIVGAGPAGLALGSHLAGSGLRVLLLDSGRSTPDNSAQELNHGSSVGHPTVDLHSSRYRKLGGTTGIWNTMLHGQPGGKYIPLDPIDFEARGAPLSGWPVAREAMEPYYQRAQALCGLRVITSQSSGKAGPDVPTLTLDGSGLRSSIYQCGPAATLIDECLARINRCGNVTVVEDVTVTGLALSRVGDRVTSVQARIGRSAHRAIRARSVVLAAGTVENARLLLASTENHADLGDAQRWLGSCFMEHPRDSSLVLRFRTPRAVDLRFYSLRESREGDWTWGHLVPWEEALRSERLPNFSIILAPLGTGIPAPGWRGGWSRAALLRSEWMAGASRGWNAATGRPSIIREARLLVHMEQLPDPENRVTLSQHRDHLGMRRPELRWHWSRADRERFDRVVRFIGDMLSVAGVGTVHRQWTGVPDPNGHHHAGAARMSPRPDLGVTDPSGRVHGVENLWVAGAALFPTCGYANPTLTILALSIRMADHLRAVMAPEPLKGGKNGEGAAPTGASP